VQNPVAATCAKSRKNEFQYFSNEFQPFGMSFAIMKMSFCGSEMSFLVFKAVATQMFSFFVWIHICKSSQILTNTSKNPAKNEFLGWLK